MTKEEKQLLIKDLACRLPYNVVVGCTEDDEPDTFFKCILTGEMLQTVINGTEYYNYTPFLRQMSSMTEEEIKKSEKIDRLKYINGGFAELRQYTLINEEFIDWLNAHHFDYRGLIEKGLAYEVTKENNPY